jgi:hypothetical protein
MTFIVEVFWIVTPCSVVVGYQNFRGQSSPRRWRQHVPPKRWYPTTTLHGVTTQMTSTGNITAVKATKLAIYDLFECYISHFISVNFILLCQLGPSAFRCLFFFSFRLSLQKRCPKVADLHYCSRNPDALSIDIPCLLISWAISCSTFGS